MRFMWSCFFQEFDYVLLCQQDILIGPLFVACKGVCSIIGLGGEESHSF